ncbi:GntR family transcriptional regulator [Lentzea sp. NPDC003310]|uniref:GntR family transcriptional regulator n=1 Tax=Lentzea sp. NPDC003310 TaxID=3154447 RepID=UPI0033BD4D97
MADQGTDSEDKRNASRRVADSVIADIQRGEWAVGKPLPTYRQLAADQGVAVNTAMAGVRLAQAEGWVEIRPNAGAVVRDRSQDVGAEHELRELRTKVEELRVTLRRVGEALGGAEGDLADVVARLGAMGGSAQTAEPHSARTNAVSPSSAAPPQAAT